MNKNAEKWIEALRSGSYKQTQSKLRDEYGFCCLGVACDVYMKETGNGKWTVDEFGDKFVTGKTPLHLNRYGLPMPVKKWLNITEALEFDLSQMNDKGRNFVEIAKAIEDRLK